jgi:hypothetical protein
MPVIKSLDAESHCMLKVERIEMVQTDSSSNVIRERVESEITDNQGGESVEDVVLYVHESGHLEGE